MIAVIPSIGRSPLLAPLVRTLLDDGVAVRVVDNTTHGIGASRDLLDDVLENPRLLWLAVPGQGIYRTWNYGLDLGDRQYGNVLVLNDDIVLRPGAATEMDALLTRSGFGVLSFFDRSRLDQLRIRRACGGNAIAATTNSARVGKGHGICGYAFAANPSKCARCDEEYIWWCGDDDLFYGTARGGSHVGIAFSVQVEHPKDGTSSEHVELPYGWKAHDIDRLEASIQENAPAQCPSMVGK
jgi:hypothetical protein